MSAFFSRILVQICKTQAFQKLNPAHFELHDEVSDAIQVSHHTHEMITDNICHKSLIAHIMTLISDRDAGVVHHQKGFTSAND